MRAVISCAIFLVSLSAFADALIINETPLQLQYEPDTNLEFLRPLSLTPPMANEPPPIPYRDQPEPLFLKKQPSGELAIDVPAAENLDNEFHQRTATKFDAQQFMSPNLSNSIDPNRLSVRLMGHALQEAIQDQAGADASAAAANQPATKQPAVATGKPQSGTFAADLPWFRTEGLDHPFQVQMRAADATESLVYRGLADASIQYQNEERSVGFELKKKVLFGIDLVYAYVSSPIDNRSQIKLSWNF